MSNTVMRRTPAFFSLWCLMALCLISPAVSSNTAYSAAIGPYKVATQAIILVDEVRGEVPLRALYPEAQGHFPVVVFSHGNWSDHYQYDRLVAHWASWGYVVVLPYHLDGGGMLRGIFNALRYGQLGLINSRHQDIRWLLDHLGDLQQRLPRLTRIDTERIAVAGHSFGAYSAQQMIGAGAFDEDTERYHYGRDVRVKAVVAVSPPGPMFTTINERSWEKVDQPMLVTTGTLDTNERFWPDWRQHLLSFETAQAGKNWALVVQGADHYLGNLICRPEREQASQIEALNIINAVSVAFLDWHLKADIRAQALLLNPSALGELASLSNR